MTARATLAVLAAAALVAGAAPASARGAPGGTGTGAGAFAAPAALTGAGALALAGALPVPALTGGAVLAEERAVVARLDGRRATVAAERAALEDELDALSARIVALKSRRRLFGDAELTHALQTSRDLSARIDRLGREEERLTADLTAAARRLATGYDRLVAEARRALDAAGPDDAARKAGLERLAALEAERLAVRNGIARLERGGPVPEEILPGVALSLPVARDDPEELRAQADILRDTRDRLARRLAEVEREKRRIRDQRALEREMDGFLAETRLFDEGDRAAVRFGGERPVGARGLPRAPQDESLAAPGDEVESADPSAGMDAEFDDFDGAAPPEGEADRDGSLSAPEGGESFQGSGSLETVFHLDRITTRAEASAALDALLSHEAGASIEDLEAHQEEIERLIRRLERRAEVLERRADALDHRP